MPALSTVALLTLIKEDIDGSTPASPYGHHHIAIAPWIPSISTDDSSWTIVPVRSSSALAHSTIQFSPSSLALQSFAEVLQKIAPSKLLSHSKSGIEIRVLDVVPLALDVVFVTIEDALAKRLEAGEGTFWGRERPTSDGMINGGALEKYRRSKEPEDRLTLAVREALSILAVVHAGDFFSLPLPPHPLTHVSPPPAQVTLCEPLAQGVLSDSTRIIVTRANQSKRSTRRTKPLPVKSALNGVTDDDDDTATDQFFSAAEDRYKTDAPPDESDDSATDTETEAELSSADSGSLSDDSMDDMISLQAPTLPESSMSGVSTIQAGTPMTIGPGRRTNGINTPGSVYSTMTATTARASGVRGRLFKAQGLLWPLPAASLHPRPASDDDDEARVFVDVNSLAKIGCFSGDWVRLEVAAEPPAGGAGLWSLGSFGQVDDEESVWRPVKIFGLPEAYTPRPLARISKARNEGRRGSFFDAMLKPSTPTVHMSPVLLANMDQPTHLRLSPLKKMPHLGRLSKVPPAAQPAFAREVTLKAVVTPLYTKRNMQPALLAGLKRHFLQSSRLLRSGDLVAYLFDGGLGQVLDQPIVSGDDSAMNELLSITNTDAGSQNTKRKGGNVAWFRVDHVSAARLEGQDKNEEEDIWGGLVAVDAAATVIKQSGEERARLPPTMENAWEYYLGIRQVSAENGMTLPAMRQQHTTQLRRRLRELIAAATSPRAIHLKLQPLAILLVSTQRNIGKATLATRACSDLGLHTFTIDAYDVLSKGSSGGGDQKTEAYLKARADRALSCGAEFCPLLLRHVEALTADRMASVLKDILAESRVLIATTTEVDKVPDGVRGLFTHELEMTAPDEWEREGILRSVIEDHGATIAAEVDLSAVAVKTAALVAGDLLDVVDRALVAQCSRLESLTVTPRAVDSTELTLRDIRIAAGRPGLGLTKADFDTAVDAARKNFADAIGAPKIPNVGWDDVGGLTNVKDAVMETIQLPLERPELFAKGMKKRSGILFYGPPGTGKTLLAKAIATEFSLNFFSVKGPELLNMYIGESEANVRRVFQRARDARPCVVFFDELDSVAPKRGNQGDSGGVMDRIVSQLLAELDGMSDGEEGGGGVFVIGATNRPDLLDAALLRPGRFDKMLYLGVSDTHAKQLTIMEALTRKYVPSPLLCLDSTFLPCNRQASYIY